LKESLLGLEEPDLEKADQLLRQPWAPLHHRALLRPKVEIFQALMIVFEVRQRIKSRFLGFGQKSQVVVEGAVNGRHHGYWAGEAIPARRRKREHRESNQILRIGHCSTTAWGVSYRRVKLRGKRVSTDFETSLFPPDTDYEAIERIIESPLDRNP
jgi:hypothetical protein